MSLVRSPPTLHVLSTKPLMIDKLPQTWRKSSPNYPIVWNMSKKLQHKAPAHTLRRVDHAVLDSNHVFETPNVVKVAAHIHLTYQAKTSTPTSKTCLIGRFVNCIYRSSIIIVQRATQISITCTAPHVVHRSSPRSQTTLQCNTRQRCSIQLVFESTTFSTSSPIA